MQYLSKAYNYYSGINPATLSGAIDVIVVRSVDSDGNVHLQSSPFHVRFGKLQVLRAGEKRVTMKLPNNLPPPHIAPFSMKVGESGEAFFVFETDDDISPDLLTSPIVAPTDPGDSTASEPPRDEKPPDHHPQTLTKTPFGETERNANGDLADVDYFDLNGDAHLARTESAKTDTGATLSPSSAASSKPSLAINPSSPDHVVPDTKTQPPNPLQADPGEAAGLPSRDHKLENIALAGPATEPSLPRVTAGQGDGPEVIYGKDVVLDMGGYHQVDQDIEAMESGSYDGLLQDIVKATQSSRPPLKPSRATDTVLSTDPHPIAQMGPSASSTPDLSADLSTLEIDSSDSEEEVVDRRFRGQSEPPFQHETFTGLSPPSSPPRSPRGFANSVGLGTAASHAAMDRAWDWTQAAPNGEPAIGCFRVVEDNPYLFVLDTGEGRRHTFELRLSGSATNGEDVEENDLKRITLQAFLTEPTLIDDPRITIRYRGKQWDRDSGEDLLHALSALRKTLPSPTSHGTSSIDDSNLQTGSSSWSRWWRKSPPPPSSTATLPPPPVPSESSDTVVTEQSPHPKVFAKTLRLTTEQLQQLNLKPGPNTVQFSVTSSYSGFATCSARVFLWEEMDQIVISDIDGTITKSDALGHVFAAIGRDWTHLGIAKLYTDISNNGYRMLYLTSRAIGQADSTREYLRTINQGNYRMPEGPVIMSPDRLMASLHREVIMRKPELFKMACLRDIQRLFSSYAKEAFFAGFGNRITDAMSYRSVGIDASKIYTIDSTGVVKTELLQAAGHKGSYFLLNDLVNEVFPPVRTKFKPEFTDFSYWRTSIPDIPLPDLSPPSPALSARSDTSRASSGMLSKIATLGRRSSRPILPISQPSSRPSSPLMGPAITPDDPSDLEDGGRNSSMPGSYEDPKGSFFPQDMQREEPEEERDLEEGLKSRQDSFDDSTLFDDDLLATGEMQHVPF